MLIDEVVVFASGVELHGNLQGIRLSVGVKAKGGGK